MWSQLSCAFSLIGWMNFGSMLRGFGSDRFNTIKLLTQRKSHSSVVNSKKWSSSNPMEQFTALAIFHLISWPTCSLARNDQMGRQLFCGEQRPPEWSENLPWCFRSLAYYLDNTWSKRWILMHRCNRAVTHLILQKKICVVCITMNKSLLPGRLWRDAT